MFQVSPLSLNWAALQPPVLQIIPDINDADLGTNSDRTAGIKHPERAGGEPLMTITVREGNERSSGRTKRQRKK